MVKLHAELAALPAGRATVAVDSALHLETTAITFADAAARLQEAGYVLDMGTKYAYRFDRGSKQVGIMCSDRHSIWKDPKFRGCPKTATYWRLPRGRFRTSGRTKAPVV